MKSIAITISQDMIIAIDRMIGLVEGERLNRSKIIRRAVREYIARFERRVSEEREREIIAKHRDLLAAQASALVAEQAQP